MSARLHILNKAPDHPRYRQCLETLEAGDVLVLMESGVLVLASEPPNGLLDKVQVHALSGDLETYSLRLPHSNRVQAIDYKAFVDLVCRLGSPVNW